MVARPPLPLPASASASRRAGYTILEMVGVLIVIAIIAAIVLEGVLQKMKQAARDTEAQNLTNLVAALVRNVTVAKSIPNAGTWTYFVATNSLMAVAPNWVSNNAVGNARLFLTDPNFSLPLPYTQTVVGATSPPASLRVAIVSSLAVPLPVGASFADVWTNPPGSVPATWPAPWNGNYGQDLKIQRVDLGNLFHRVLLENLEVATNAPYAVEGSSLTNVPASSQAQAWFLDSSALNLWFYPNYPSLTTSNLQGRQYIKGDVSFVFEHGRWGRYMYYGRNTAPNYGPFGNWVNAFLTSALHAPTPPASPQGIADAMYNFLYYTAQWAQQGYPAGNLLTNLNLFAGTSALVLLTNQTANLQ